MLADRTQYRALMQSSPDQEIMMESPIHSNITLSVPIDCVTVLTNHSSNLIFSKPTFQHL